MNNKLIDFISKHNINEFRDLLSVCIGKSLVNQSIWSQNIKDKNEIILDTDNGLLTIGEQNYKISFIGNEEKEKNFIWADANLKNPDDTILDVLKILEFGKEKHIAELENPKLILDEELTGNTLAIVSALLLNENGCYYKLKTEKENIYMYIKDYESEELNKSLSIQKFANIIKKCITNYDLNQELFIESLIIMNNLGIEKTENKIISLFPGDLKCEVLFDETKRITKLKFEAKK